MGTYYKGCKDIKTKSGYIVESFMHGFILTQGEKKRAENGCTKYNLEIIRRINSLQQSFRILIVVESIAISLLEMSPDCDEIEIQNIWNLMRAQSGTIKVNTFYIKGLKTYQVKHKEVYNALNTEIEKQEDRIKRNYLLIKELMSDYGLGDVLNLIKEDTGLDIFKHVELLMDNKNTDDYTEFKNEYLQYLNQLADKNNLSLTNFVSESLKRYRELRNSSLEETRNQIQDKKDREKYNKLLRIIENDNERIQRNINAYGTELEVQPITMNKIISKMTELGSKVYYVAYTPGGGIRYLTSDSTETQGVKNIGLFKTEDDAMNCYNIALSNIDKLEKYTYKICRLDRPLLTDPISDDFDCKIYEVKLDLITKVLNGNNVSMEDAAFVNKILIKLYGVNSNKVSGTVLLYRVRKINKNNSCTEDSKFVQIVDGKIKLTGQYRFATIFTNTKYERKLLELVEIEYKRCIIERCVLNINSRWYENTLNDIRKLNDENSKSCNLAVLAKLKDFKRQGYHKVYYVISKLFRDEHNQIYYYCKANNTQRTEYFDRATLFTSEEDALAILSKIGTSIVSRVVSIDLDALNLDNNILSHRCDKLFTFKKLKVHIVLDDSRNYNKLPYLFNYAYKWDYFVLVHADTLADARKIMKKQGKKGINPYAEYRRSPYPEISGLDFANIIEDIKYKYGQWSSNTYLCYSVNLYTGEIDYSLIRADSLESARQLGADLLSRKLNLKVTVDNLMLSGNGVNALVSYLKNSYVGKNEALNMYCTYDMYHVGVVKLSESLTQKKIYCDWVDKL